MKRKQLFNAIAIILATSGLVACGGGSSDSTTTTDTIASKTIIGTVDGFGSVYVNGVKFETDSATDYDVDDNDIDSSQSDLAVGMKVRIEGQVNDDRVTGSADSITYDDDVEGPIDSSSMTADATTKTFSVLGMKVMVDATTTVFDDGAAFDTLAEGDIIEVSGYFDGTQIVASRIELQDASDIEYEVKGTVDRYDETALIIELTLQTGASVSYPVRMGAESDLNDGDSGQFVEVKLEDTAGGLEAIEIELDDDDLLEDNEDEVNLYGVLGGDYIAGFTVNDVTLDLSGSVEYEPTSLEGNLIEGMEVEVEGSMVDGILIVDEIEAEAESEIGIEAGVTQVVANVDGTYTISLNVNGTATVPVIYNSNTLLEDDSALDTDGDGSFSITELSETDFVEAEAYQSGTDLIATKIKRKDASDETTLEAPFVSYDPNVSVTLLVDISYSLSSSTSYFIDGVASNHDDFFNTVKADDIIEVEDEGTDGTADKIEMDTSN